MLSKSLRIHLRITFNFLSIIIIIIHVGPVLVYKCFVIVSLSLWLNSRYLLIYVINKVVVNLCI